VRAIALRSSTVAASSNTLVTGFNPGDLWV
jgi:hypothetical protein